MLKKEIAQLKGNTKLGVMVRSLIDLGIECIIPLIAGLRKRPSDRAEDIGAEFEFPRGGDDHEASGGP